ncbi:uncharacterized protein LOC103926669 isoform X3 [Pyrus x bretschneideri]|uniref:uncharacterized protein LOC103926669 isoform X3 n=1 Tax=Pyrus x bretschneideri TaxID=225117 RepID=UPI00202F90E6|nr:uncharacterized protein LOC103926669 isoform X3 [Pyrus x bretschneideri]
MAVVCSFICCPSRRVSGGWTVTESGEIKLSQRAEETERQRDREREKERERDREREMPRGRQQGEVWLLSAISFAVLQGGFGGMDCDRAFSSHLDSRVEAQKANMAKRELSSTLRNLKVYAKSNLERGEERRRCQTIPYHLRILRLITKWITLLGWTCFYSYISTFPLIAFNDWISRVYFPCFDHFIWLRVLGFGEFFIKLNFL